MKLLFITGCFLRSEEQNLPAKRRLFTYEIYIHFYPIKTNSYYTTVVDLLPCHSYLFHDEYIGAVNDYCKYAD